MNFNPFRRNGGDAVEPQERNEDLANAVVSADIAQSLFGYTSTSGVAVNQERVNSLPAVARAISMLANDLAGRPLRVINPIPTEAPEEGAPPFQPLADASWQWTLLHDKPNSEISAFEFWRNAATSLVGHSNLFIEKLSGAGKFRTQVVELHVLDPNCMSVRRNDSGQLEYQYRQNDWMPASRIIHIRAWSPNPADLVAPTPIALFKNTFGHYLGANQYMDSFYRNGASPAGVITFPEGLNPEQTREFMQLWNAQHRGAGNAHKEAVLGGGADYKAIGVSPADAQYIEAVGLMIDDIARIFGVPAARLDAHYKAPVNPGDDDLYHQTVNTLATLIEEGLRCDGDLFPTTVKIRPKFYHDTLSRLAPDKQYATFAQAKQQGILTGNEIRAMVGRPPLPGGDTLIAISAGAGATGTQLEDGTHDAPNTEPESPETDTNLD